MQYNSNLCNIKGIAHGKILRLWTDINIEICLDNGSIFSNDKSAWAHIQSNLHYIAIVAALSKGEAFIFASSSSWRYTVVINRPCNLYLLS